MNFNVTSPDLSVYCDVPNSGGEKNDDRKVPEHYERFEQILKWQNNSDQNLQYLENLSQKDFELYIGIFASELIRKHIKNVASGYVDHAFGGTGGVNDLIVRNTIVHGLIDRDIDLTQMRFDQGDTVKSLGAEYVISLTVLKQEVFQRKVEDRNNFQSAIKTVQESMGGALK